MPRIRLNPLDSKEIVFNGVDGESLQQTYDRLLVECDIPNDPNLHEYFEVSMSGHVIERKMWTHIKPKNHKVVLIAIVAKGGGDNSALRTALTIAAIVAIAYVNPYAAGTFASTAFTIGATAVATMAINAIVPPPELEIGGLGIDVGYDTERSQMYSITAQANATKKFGTVPRVYGRHRIFPVVAATPYTEIEPSSETGELVQFFYAVYDFGFGPLSIEDIQIGDTPIDQFNITDTGDAENSTIVGYRLVDFNKPTTDEGEWDAGLENELLWYKGDNNFENVSAAINKDADDPNAVVSQYQVVRNAAPDVGDDQQELQINFAFPRGLYSQGTTGNVGDGRVNLKIEFAEVGTEDWVTFNNRAKVKNNDFVGNVDADTTSGFFSRSIMLNPGVTTELLGVKAFEREVDYWEMPEGVRNSTPLNAVENPPYSTQYKYLRVDYYYERGTNEFYENPAGNAVRNNVGNYLVWDGQNVGEVISSENIEVSPGVYLTKQTIDAGISSAKLALTNYYKLEWNGTGYDIVSDYYDYFGRTNYIGPIKRYAKLLLPGDGVISIIDNKTEPVYAVVKFEPRVKGIQYKVRVTRLSSAPNLNQTYRVEKDLTWTTLNTRFDRTPIVTDKRHVFLELKIKATDQLNGSIKNLSGVASSILDVYDPNTQAWSKSFTNNPAWVYADVLTGPVNKRPLAKSKLDVDSLVEWANYCDEIPPAGVNNIYRYKRYECNFVLDYKGTVQTVLNQLTTAAQASFNLVNGRYGVLLDINKTIPIQVFTTRNSNGFSMSRSYIDLPHAFKVKYIDKSSGWEVKEAVVYSDGFNALNSTIFEELDAFACTNHEQAYRYGRYMLFQGVLRRETYSLTVDFEYLVCTRGDYVKFQHDAILGGGLPARVKAVNGTEITIDDGFVTAPATSYSYEFRSTTDGEIHSGNLTITSSTTANVSGEIPEVGDLFVWGETDKVTIDCIVKSIVPQDELKAQLLLVEKQDAVYDFETSATIPDYESLISNVGELADEAPGLIQNFQVFENSYRCGVGEYEYYVQIIWTPPEYNVADKYEVYVDNGKGFELVGIVKDTTFEYVVDRSYLNITHKFKVLGVSSLGQKKPLGELEVIEATPTIKSVAPQDITSLYSNIVSETIQLEWTPPTEECIAEFLIRYSKNYEAKWESSIPVDRVDGNSLTTSLSARSGAYFIKAIDYEGNESVNAAKVVTSIPELSGLNLVESINDFNVLDGAYDRVVKQGNTLLLDEAVSGLPEDTEYYTEGFYNYKDFLDLGEIYTVRLQSLIEAEGYTIGDLISAWITLADVDAMSTTSTSDWDVETQVRTRETFFKMANWPTLDVIDPISEGDQSQWGAWRKFTIGDFTGRIFQFRLRLLSNKASVTPRVIDGLIKADMPDRDIRIDDMTTVAATLSINFDNYGGAYYGPGTKPLVQITQENAIKGDRYVVSNKTLNGFDITFYDINDVVVARTFDALIKGYGRKTNEVI